LLNKLKHTAKLFSLSQWLGNKPVFIFFLLSFSVFGQENLVPNGNFEEYETCPSSNPPYYFVDRATHWFMPSLGSSDYFNSCSQEVDPDFGGHMFSVPQNNAGYQSALSGNAYAGYYGAFSPNNNNYYEYLSVKLLHKLEQGKIYHLSYYLSLADSLLIAATGRPQQSANHTAALLSESISFQNNDYRIDSPPQFVSDPNVMLIDSLGWQKVDGYIVSNGNEEYLTIGFFCNFEDLTLNYFDGINATIYYYIDDVSLVEENVDIPNVFTPNNDGVNDLLELKFSSKVMELTIMNRWGNKVFSSLDANTMKWNGTWQGNNCEEGVYFYELKIGSIKKTGFIQLMR